MTLPGAEALRGVPVLGPIYAEVISGHTLLVYRRRRGRAAHRWVVYRTRFGLRLRAVGENPPRSTPPASRSRACAIAPC